MDERLRPSPFRVVEVEAPTPANIIKWFFRYEGVKLKARAVEAEDMSDAERLLLWLRVNGFKVVPMTHLDCTDD